ncbi:MAG: hypothetical protein Q9176_006449 [Flavoplaca citrina]
MHYNILALLCLSIPLLSQAGPVQPTGDESDLSLTAVEFDHGALMARADEEECGDTGKCEERGRTLWNALQETLKNPDAEDVIQYDDPFKNDYDDVVSWDTSPDAGSWRDYFQKTLHLDYEKHFAQHDITAKSDGSTRSYSNLYNTNQGVMVSPWNFKEYDKTSSVPFSEMLFQCYKAECDEEKELKSFQFAGINTIVEETYETVSLEVYRRSGRRTLMPNWEKWTFADNENDFLALIGTPKLACFLRMLNDHSVAFGKRLPTELWTNRRARSAYLVVDEFKG